MKKIPTLFVRQFENHKVVKVTEELTEGLEFVLSGECVPTEKIDGACCCIMDGKFYRRYDAKKGKQPPIGAIPCCDPDPITGHHPHWVLCDSNNPNDRWFIEALNNYRIEGNWVEDWTYEAIGPHFQGNPYDLQRDILVPHGRFILYGLKDISYKGIKGYLEKHNIEGIVFWKDNKPICKIKRSDFGFPWGNGSNRKKVGK